MDLTLANQQLDETFKHMVELFTVADLAKNDFLLPPERVMLELYNSIHYLSSALEETIKNLAELEAKVDRLEKFHTEFPKTPKT